MDLSQYHPQMMGAPMLQKSKNNHMSFLNTQTGFSYRPLSEATEILDTDYEAEFSDDESPRRSVESFGNDSSTTLSTPDDLPTPTGFDSTSFPLQLGPSKPVQGPSGPHLFRISMDASSIGFKPEEDQWHQNLSMSPLVDEPVNQIWVPQKRRSSEPNRMLEMPRSTNRAESIAQMSPQQDKSAPVSFVRSWSPTEVAEWMYESGVEDNMVERFIQNDISGAVLLDLHMEDLKELEIHSFGKRHLLMNMIQNLRNNDFASSPNVAVPRIEQSPSPPVPQLSRSISSRGSESRECDSQSPGSDRRSPPVPRRRGRHNRVITEQDIISPGESVSIVAIEQLMPKPHKCSKGENCAKYQKRQRKLARIAKEFPKEFAQVGQETLASPIAMPPPRPATTDNNRSSNNSTNNNTFLRPKSYTTPSLVASSDVLGPAQMPEVQLNAENLNGVQPRDPQENVRQFLTFQHMDESGTSNEPLETFPPLSPPDGNSPTDHVANQLRTLPKLTIPGQSHINEQPSGQRTITPSMVGRTAAPITAIHETNPHNFNQDIYRNATPFSEMDVPTTAFPIEPLARDASQSVPPNMMYGNMFIPPRDPISRSSSAQPGHRRRPSFPTMAPLNEDEPLHSTGQNSSVDSNLFLSPQSQSAITQQPPSSLTAHHIAPYTSRDPYAAHSGWMKKRKTRLLRHEWQDAHFTLKGTVLAMHKDEQEARRKSRALESIDVDDYAVACSSVASNSKLASIFKRSALRKAASVSVNGSSFKGADETAFAFSLVPSSQSAVEKKPIFTPSSKSHHFAVKTRDDRIDWMRELMLAKALKKGREGGNEVMINGNVI